MRRPHRVAVLAVPPVVGLDFTIPSQVLGRLAWEGRWPYEVVPCTADPGVVDSSVAYGFVIEEGLDALAGADTVIVPGTNRKYGNDERVLAALRTAAAAGTRTVSICTGAFVLAEAGILDGRRATTHWAYTAEFRARFPRVELDPSVLFVDGGTVLTSAGLAAGIDLCLHLIRTDLGAAAANAAARSTVVSPIRTGGQAQFIAAPTPENGERSLAATRAWAGDRLAEPLGLAELAAHAGVSVRTLSRRFRAETGLSPLQWLLQQRIDLARELLETTGLPMDVVARRSGLGTADSLRAHLHRRVGVTPTAYRTAFSRAGASRERGPV
ncbi:MAG: helix-turn-helix domain-containing protein [Streptosporangiales bacterium]|nr:helix-turn-helix domain-containing protein [Streptosporangiales bacterium]